MSSLIVSDIVFPSQLYQRYGCRSILDGERRLMLAVLEDAIMCYQKYAAAPHRHSRYLFEETETWLFQKGASGPFSFESICTVLQLDPAYVREGLERWRWQLLARSADRRMNHAMTTLEKPRAAERGETQNEVDQDVGLAAAAPGNTAPLG